MTKCLNCGHSKGWHYANGNICQKETDIDGKITLCTCQQFIPTSKWHQLFCGRCNAFVGAVDPSKFNQGAMIFCICRNCESLGAVKWIANLKGAW